MYVNSLENTPAAQNHEQLPLQQNSRKARIIQAHLQNQYDHQPLNNTNDTVHNTPQQQSMLNNIPRANSIYAPLEHGNFSNATSTPNMRKLSPPFSASANLAGINTFQQSNNNSNNKRSFTNNSNTYDPGLPSANPLLRTYIQNYNANKNQLAAPTTSPFAMNNGPISFSNNNNNGPIGSNQGNLPKSPQTMLLSNNSHPFLDRLRSSDLLSIPPTGTSRNPMLLSISALPQFLEATGQNVVRARRNSVLDIGSTSPSQNNIFLQQQQNQNQSPQQQHQQNSQTYRLQAAMAALQEHAGASEQRLSAPERRNAALSAMSIRWLRKQAIADQELREQQAARNAILVKERDGAAAMKKQLGLAGSGGGGGGGVGGNNANQIDVTSGPVSMTLTNDQHENQDLHQKQATASGMSPSSTSCLPGTSGATTRSEVVPGFILEVAQEEKRRQQLLLLQNNNNNNNGDDLFQNPTHQNANTSGTPQPKSISSRYLTGVTGAYNQAVRRKLILTKFSEVIVFLGHQAKDRLQSQQDKLEFLLTDSAATRISAKATSDTFKLLQDIRRQNNIRRKKRKRQEKLDQLLREQEKTRGELNLDSNQSGTTNASAASLLFKLDQEKKQRKREQQQQQQQQQQNKNNNLDGNNNVIHYSDSDSDDDEDDGDDQEEGNQKKNIINGNTDHQHQNNKSSILKSKQKNGKENQNQRRPVVSFGGEKIPSVASSPTSMSKFENNDDSNNNNPFSSHVENTLREDEGDEDPSNNNNTNTGNTNKKKGVNFGAPVKKDVKIKNVKDWFDAPITPVMNEIEKFSMKYHFNDDGRNSPSYLGKVGTKNKSEVEMADQVRTAKELQDEILDCIDCGDDENFYLHDDDAGNKDPNDDDDEEEEEESDDVNSNNDNNNNNCDNDDDDDDDDDRYNYLSPNSRFFNNNNDNEDEGYYYEEVEEEFEVDEDGNILSLSGNLIDHQNERSSSSSSLVSHLHQQRKHSSNIDDIETFKMMLNNKNKNNSSSSPSQLVPPPFLGNTKKMNMSSDTQAPPPQHQPSQQHQHNRFSESSSLHLPTLLESLKLGKVPDQNKTLSSEELEEMLLEDQLRKLQNAKNHQGSLHNTNNAFPTSQESSDLSLSKNNNSTSYKSKLFRKNLSGTGGVLTTPLSTEDDLSKGKTSGDDFTSNEIPVPLLLERKPESSSLVQNNNDNKLPKRITVRKKIIVKRRKERREMSSDLGSHEEETKVIKKDSPLGSGSSSNQQILLLSSESNKNSTREGESPRIAKPPTKNHSSSKENSLTPREKSLQQQQSNKPRTKPNSSSSLRINSAPKNSLERPSSASINKEAKRTSSSLTPRGGALTTKKNSSSNNNNNNNKTNNSNTGNKKRPSSATGVANQEKFNQLNEMLLLRKGSAISNNSNPHHTKNNNNSNILEALMDLAPTHMTRRQRNRLLRKMTLVERDHFNRHRVVAALQAQIDELEGHVDTLNELKEELRDHRGTLSDRFVSRMMQISQIVAGCNWGAVAKTTYCTPVDPWVAFEGLLNADLLGMLLDTTALIPHSSGIGKEQNQQQNQPQQPKALGNSQFDTSRNTNATTANNNNNNIALNHESGNDAATDILSQNNDANDKSSQSLALVLPSNSNVPPALSIQQQKQLGESTTSTTMTSTGVAKIVFNFDKPESVSEVNFKRMLDERLRDCVNFAHQDGLLAELGVFLPFSAATSAKLSGEKKKKNNKNSDSEKMNNTNNYEQDPRLQSNATVTSSNPFHQNSGGGGGGAGGGANFIARIGQLKLQRVLEGVGGSALGQETQRKEELQKLREFKEKQEQSLSPFQQQQQQQQRSGNSTARESVNATAMSRAQLEIEKAIADATEKAKNLRPVPKEIIPLQQQQQQQPETADSVDERMKASLLSAATPFAFTDNFFEQISKYDAANKQNQETATNNLDFTMLFDFDGTRQDLAQQHLKLTQKQQEAQKKSEWSSAPLHDQVALWFAVLKRVAPKLSVAAFTPGLWDEGSNVFDDPKNQYKLGLSSKEIRRAAKPPEGRLAPYFYFATMDGDIVGVPAEFILNPDGEDFHPAKIRAAILLDRKRKEEERKTQEDEQRKRLQDEEKQIYEQLAIEKKKKELAKKKKQQKQAAGNLPSWLQKEKKSGTENNATTTTAASNSNIADAKNVLTSSSSPLQQSISPQQSPRSGGSPSKQEKPGAILPDGRRASLVEQARKIMQEKYAHNAAESGAVAANQQGKETNNSNNNSNNPKNPPSSNSKTGATTTASNTNNNNTNSKSNANTTTKTSPPRSTSPTSSALLKKKKKRTAATANSANENDTDQFGAGTQHLGGTKKKGILVALAAAYSNIEKLAREATIPTADPTRRRDTLTELFPKIRVFTGHDGFAVRCLKAARSVTLGSVLLSCGEDKVIRISRTYSQELLVVVPGAFAIASGLHLEFYTDRLLSVHLDGSLRMWETTSDPPKSKVILEAVMPSSQKRIRMEDVGQLFHETFHGHFQRNKYDAVHMLGGGRSKRGSLILKSAAGTPQASLSELMKDAPAIASLANISGLMRTSVGEAIPSSLHSNNNNKKKDTKDGKDSSSSSSGLPQQTFRHKIPITSLSWALEVTPCFQLPTPGKKSIDQIFAIGTALGHIYVCRWGMESTEIESDNESANQSDNNSDNNSDGGDPNINKKRRASNKSVTDESVNSCGRDTEDTGNASTEDETATNDAATTTASEFTTTGSRGRGLGSRRQSTLSNTQIPTQAGYAPGLQRKSSIVLNNNNNNNVTGPNSSLSAAATIEQIQNRLNDELNKKYKIQVPTSNKKSKKPQQVQDNNFAAYQQDFGANANSNTVVDFSSSTKRLVSSQSRQAASRKRLERGKQRDRDAASAAVSPVLALMPGPFDAPLVSMVNWNINHLDRPNLTKDEQAGAAFGHGLDISAAQKAKMLEDVDAAASETMAKLRDAVGAEDRAAAREAQRRKTAGVNGDPQTNGGAPIPGHSCGISCTIMPGNHFLFSGDDRGVILMWDCRGAFAQDAAIFRRPRKRFQGGHVDSVTSLAATSDGLLCSASKDALVVVWSWIDGVKLHTLHQHHHIVTSLSLATQYVPHVNHQEYNDNNDGANQNVQREYTGRGGVTREPSVFSATSTSINPNNAGDPHTSRSRRSSVVSKSSSQHLLNQQHANQIKPWTGGVVVNHRRNNDDPHRSVTARTLLITSSLDETVQCFEINPAGTAAAAAERALAQQQQQEGGGGNNVNSTNASFFSAPLGSGQTQTLTGMGRRFSEFMDPHLVTPGGLNNGMSFASSNFTRSRANSTVGFI